MDEHSVRTMRLGHGEICSEKREDATT
jgi:hypothetical protein